MEMQYGDEITSSVLVRLNTVTQDAIQPKKTAGGISEVRLQP